MTSWRAEERGLSEPRESSTAEGPEQQSNDLPSLSLADLLSEPTDVDSLAELLGDRYTPLSRLGAGTFGEVIRARDQLLGREVAVKRVRLEAFSAPGQLEEVKTRFLREARVAARLRHPNIVTTHDIVSTPRSSFIVMELVEGRDLDSLLRERGRLGLEETLDILGQVAGALDHAHASSVVHRDVKPANIMIERSGRVKVMDFGIAKVEQGGNLTSTGLIMGTPNYMSPEQAKGLKVDARADVFSLGCVLYECLSGRKPFQDESVTAILLKVVVEAAPPIDFEALGLPRALDGVLKKAMAKEPGLRFAAPGGLMEAARRASRGVEVSPVPGGVKGTVVAMPPVVAARRVSRPLVALALVIVAGGVLGIVALRGSDSTPSPSPGADRRLVVEEEQGFLARLFGRAPRVFIRVPAETLLSIEMRTPVSSATARPGDAITAQVVERTTIEGQEAIGTGARVNGRVSRAESAQRAGGRGRLNLDFDSVVLADGTRVRIESDPVELTAPRPRPTKGRKKGLAGAWDQLAATVGEIVREAKGGDRTGGVAGAHAVQGDNGVDVEVPAGSTLRVELTRAVTITRVRPSS
jgi:tRNA A-37 threonylcarbamoyl transferase component Bud32